MKQEFSDSSNRQRISYIAKSYDNLWWAERLFRRNPPTSLWDWVRDRQLSIVRHYVSSSFSNSGGRATALDIGCSSGRYTKALLEEGIRAVGMDIGNIPLGYAIRWVPGADFLRASVVNLPFEKDSFDCVICIELLHHFTDKVAGEALREVARVTKRGGLFIFDLKNKWNPVMWYLYRRKDSVEFTLKTRTVSRMIRLVGESGFTVTKKKGIPGVPLVAPFIVLCATKAGGK